MDRKGINSKSFIVRRIGCHGGKRSNGHERSFNRNSYAIQKRTHKLQTWPKIANLTAIAKDCTGVFNTDICYANVYKKEDVNGGSTKHTTELSALPTTSAATAQSEPTPPQTTASTSTVTSGTSLMRRVMQANMRICAATSHVRNINRLKIFRFKTNDRKILNVDANMISHFSNYLRCVQRYRNFRYMKPIYLPTIHSDILIMIIEWLQYHRDVQIENIDSRVLLVNDTYTYRIENVSTDKAASMRINDNVTEYTTTTTTNEINEHNQQNRCSDMPNSSSFSDLNTFSDDKCSEIFSEPTATITATSEAERSEWYKIFFNIDLDKLVQLVMAANYLDIEPLMAQGTTCMADLMLLRSTQELITLSAINFSLTKANKLEKNIPEVRQRAKAVADERKTIFAGSCKSLRACLKHDLKRLDRENRGALRSNCANSRYISISW